MAIVTAEDLLKSVYRKTL